MWHVGCDFGSPVGSRDVGYLVSDSGMHPCMERAFDKLQVVKSLRFTGLPRLEFYPPISNLVLDLYLENLGTLHT